MVWTPTWVHCGQEKKQRCCEMEPSSRWGNWDRKWGSVWGHDVQTQQSEDFVFPTIPYSPTRSCCHTHTHECTHVQTHHASRSFIPWRWECDINQSVPTTPVTSTVSPAPPPILAAPSCSYPVCVTVERQPHQNTLQWALDQHSQRGSERKVKWAEEREAADMKSCLDSSLTDMGISNSLDAINYHSALLKQW